MDPMRKMSDDEMMILLATLREFASLALGFFTSFFFICLSKEVGEAKLTLFMTVSGVVVCYMSGATPPVNTPG